MLLDGFHDGGCEVFGPSLATNHKFSILQCIMEGLEVAFQTQSQFSANRGRNNEVYAEVRNCLSFLVDSCILVECHSVNTQSYELCFW